jgi:hypothetical protein
MADALPPPHSAVAVNYNTFIALLRERRLQLALPFNDLNDLAKLPGGYANKILLGTHRKGVYSAIGPESMEKLLAALDCGIQLVQRPPCKSSDGDGSEDCPQLSPTLKLLRERGRKGGRLRYDSMNSQERGKFHRAGQAASAAVRRASSAARKKQLARDAKKAPPSTRRTPCAQDGARG